MTRCAALLAIAALGGCSTVSSVIGDPNIAPGKFAFLHCEDIGKRLATALTREQELLALMDRARTDTGGTAVNWFVYGPDLDGVEAELRALRQAAGEKRCPDDIVKATPKADIAPLH